MKHVFLILIAISFNAFGDFRRFDGDIESARERILEVGTKYEVPPCRKWLIVDAHKYNNSLWFEVNGSMEIGHPRFIESSSHFISGKFTYTTGPELQKVMSIINPGSVVYIRGKTKFPILIKQFTWTQEKKCKP